MEQIAENKVIIENGKIKTIFIENDHNGEWLDIEESRRLCHEMVNKTRELLKQKNANINK
jgi:hypothetical protein